MLSFCCCLFSTKVLDILRCLVTIFCMVLVKVKLTEAARPTPDLLNQDLHFAKTPPPPLTQVHVQVWEALLRKPPPFLPNEGPVCGMVEDTVQTIWCTWRLFKTQRTEKKWFNYVAASLFLFLLNRTSYWEGKRNRNRLACGRNSSNWWWCVNCCWARCN